jgi:hypothetical protein
MLKQSDCTIIIPHLGGTKEAEYSLDQCIASIIDTSPEMPFLLAKNGIDCKQHDEDIYVNSQGQCKAVNAAVAATNTPWILVTNDDMIFSKGWFERLVNVDPTIKCISPKLVEPRPGAPTFDVFFAGGAGGDFNKKLWEGYAQDYYEHRTYGVRTGFNLPFLIRRDVWDTVGGYDINYDPWGSNSDSDLEYKIKLADVQPYQNCNSIVYHFSQTSGTFEPRNDSFRFKNYGYFREKWGFERTDNGIWEANFEIPTAEEGRIFAPDWEGKWS